MAGPELCALVAGGGTAGLLHGATSSLRAGSTATTGGLANPVFAGVEMGFSTVLTILAIAIPLAALAVVVLLLINVTRVLRGGWRRLRRA